MLYPYLWPDTATVTPGGLLQIGGCDLPALAAEYGTPLYLLDEVTLRASCRAYCAAFARHYPGPTSVHYAAKALLNLAVAQLVTQEGLGLDVVSAAELAVVRAAGVDLGRAHLHGNAKTSAELGRALAWQVGHIVVDTLDELLQLAALSAALPHPQPVMLRLAPAIAVDTHAHIATGHAGSKFGLPLEALDQAAALISAAPGLRLAGLHAHLGSQLFDVTPFRSTVECLLDAAALLRDRYGITVDTISPGGGLGVSYTPDQQPPDLDLYAREIAQAVQAGCRRRGMALPRLVVEPGRSIIARAGVALYRIVGRKQASGQTPYAHIDGGMGDNLRPALYGARYHGLLANRAAALPAEATDIAGRFCESGDVLIRNLELPEVAVGDLLVVAVAGAYTLSMANNYNLVPRPALLLLGEGSARLIQRRETDEDLLRRDFSIADEK